MREKPWQKDGERGREIPMTKQDESPYKGAAHRREEKAGRQEVGRREETCSKTRRIASRRANNTIR